MSNLVGHELTRSAKINGHIEELVKEIRNHSAKIKAPKPADPQNKEAFKSLCDKIAANRGRPLYLPYIGTGIGNGSLVELEDGSIKIDLINGIGINLMGHSHPRVIAATIKGALSDIVVQGNLEPNLEYVKFGELVTGLVKKNSRLRHAWITTCGTMANEIALKISRQKRAPARKIISIKDSFAGRSTLMTEITDNPAFKEGQPHYDEAFRIPFFDSKNPRSTEIAAQEMKKHFDQHKGQISAFMFEIVQGEGGFKVGSKEFFLTLFDICKQNNALIWADEVQTFSRTGELFAFEKLDIGMHLDFVTFAKTAQVGCALFTEEMNPKPGLIAGTFAGASASLSAGIEIINMLVGDGFLGTNGKIEKVYRDFTGMLEGLAAGSCKGLIDDIGGIGLMVACRTLDGSKAKAERLLKVMFENGLIAYYCGHGPYKLRFLIPAIISSEEIKMTAKVIETSILQVAKEA
ncbi:MAG: aminotransferase class III-fold pyridoxal phosphate-dependent enzyme [Pseudomonadota bacterium]|nr:aminotransferase class III-fold pyridoxal phosphate-dependent enzyme [Pseudomonadota bacterium]